MTIRLKQRESRMVTKNIFKNTFRLHFLSLTHSPTSFFQKIFWNERIRVVGYVNLVGIQFYSSSLGMAILRGIIMILLMPLDWMVYRIYPAWNWVTIGEADRPRGTTGEITPRLHPERDQFTLPYVFDRGMWFFLYYHYRKLVKKTEQDILNSHMENILKRM